MNVEQPQNRQGDRRLQRRPSPAVASPGTTPGFFPSHTVGLSGAEAAPKTRGSSIRPTLNRYHVNSPTAPPTAWEKPGRLRTAWDLPQLIRPLPVRRQHHERHPRQLVHYPAFIDYIFRHRFATAAQLQQRFPNLLRSERTAQYQAASLVRLGYLGLAPVRSTGPNFPFVYFVTGRGLRILKETYARLGRQFDAVPTEQAKTKGTALDSILHELLLTEFDLTVWKTVQRRGDLDILFSERRYFQADNQLRFWHNGRQHRVIPDGGFLLRLADHPMPRLLLNFVELDNGTMSLARIAEKYHQYDQWASSSDGRQYLTALFARHGSRIPSPNFRLLVIAHDKHEADADNPRLLDLFSQALDLSAGMRDRLWLTTAAAIHAHQHEAAPLDQPLWFRVRDARRWLADYRALLAGLPRGRGHKQYHHQRQFVASRLPSLPLHPLFPHAKAAIAQ